MPRKEREGKEKREREKEKEEGRERALNTTIPFNELFDGRHKGERGAETAAQDQEAAIIVDRSLARGDARVGFPLMRVSSHLCVESLYKLLLLQSFLKGTGFFPFFGPPVAQLHPRQSSRQVRPQVAWRLVAPVLHAGYRIIGYK